jgi:hypothetical protein
MKDNYASKLLRQRLSRKMSDHLTQAQIEDYGRRSLAAVDLLFVSDHLGLCDACRRQVQRALNGDAAYLGLRSELFDETELISSLTGRTHLTFEQLVGAVDATLAGEDLQVVEDHLASCQQCALAVDDLRAFKDQVEPELDRQDKLSSVSVTGEKSRHRWIMFWPKSLAFGSALAALLLAVSGLMVWQSLTGTKEEPRATVTTPSPAPSVPVTPGMTSRSTELIALLNDGSGQVSLDKEGKLSGVDRLPPAYQQMVKGALTNQEIERSPLLAGLTTMGSTPRGGGDETSDKFSLITPVRTVAFSNQPVFRWSRLNGAASYVVEIYNEDFDLVAASPRIINKRWQRWRARQPLKHGGVYYWQVKAIKDGRELVSPNPPSQQAKFRILDEAKVNELERARRAYGSSHLLLGLLYTESGLLDDAEKEFRALQKANPNSEIADRLLQQVRASR